MKATYFFSFRSPYSWIASLQLKKLIEKGDELELVPFFEPDAISQKLLSQRGGEFPYRVMSDAKHRYILKDIRRLTTKMGIEHKWPVDPAPWWEPSHLGYLKAKELGFSIPYFWEVYKARWHDEINISLPESIFRICIQAGIDEQNSKLIAAASDDDNIRAQGAESLYRIYREDIFGVPMFVKKRQQYWGIDRLSDFLSFIGHETTLDNLDTKTDEHEHPLEFDHAGGCG